ncbi:unnamed protein product [Prorocentrum cordatum]|uniref:SREBP regulating gene protein n=1 Tax=Prorocentrum cordatum TaxID=2364126 RepID=A0ABN9VNE2_9DINO|nr:unnamed protein product [Polarella glacialis]
MAPRAHHGPLALVAASAPGLASLLWHSVRSNLLAAFFSAEAQRVVSAGGEAARGSEGPHPDEGSCGVAYPQCPDLICPEAPPCALCPALQCQACPDVPGDLDQPDYIGWAVSVGNLVLTAAAGCCRRQPRQREAREAQPEQAPRPTAQDDADATVLRTEAIRLRRAIRDWAVLRTL